MNTPPTDDTQPIAPQDRPTPVESRRPARPAFWTLDRLFVLRRWVITVFSWAVAIGLVFLAHAVLSETNFIIGGLAVAVVQLMGSARRWVEAHERLASSHAAMAREAERFNNNYQHDIGQRNHAVN